MAERTCVVRACDDPSYCRDFCIRHYRRWRRYGDPLGGRDLRRLPRLSRGSAIDERFWIKVDVATADACWEWLGGKTKSGHGVYRGAEVRTVFDTEFAHRIAWLLAGREFIPGLVLDHLCRNRPCGNVAHLEQVTLAVNTMRGTGPTALNAEKDECPAGHPYSPENTYVASGSRFCKACARAHTATYRQRKAARLT